MAADLEQVLFALSAMQRPAVQGVELSLFPGLLAAAHNAARLAQQQDDAGGGGSQQQQQADQDMQLGPSGPTAVSVTICDQETWEVSCSCAAAFS